MAIRCTDGVVLGVEKLVVSKMLVPGSNRRIFHIDKHVGVVRPPCCGLPLLPPSVTDRMLGCVVQAVTGLLADGRMLVNQARSECRGYRSFYGHSIPGRVINDRMSAYASSRPPRHAPLLLLLLVVLFEWRPAAWVDGLSHGFEEAVGAMAGSYVHKNTLFGHVRPYGVGLLMGVYDTDGPQLYAVEPSGLSYGYYAYTMGKGRQLAKSEIEKLKLQTITCREAIQEVTRMYVHSSGWLREGALPGGCGSS